MRPDELINAVKRYDKNADVEALRRAAVFAQKMHHDQWRETGEKYLIHPLAVAEILVEYKLDANGIMAALLHDTVEDTPASYESVKTLFGKEVADLVQGLTKLESYQLQSINTDQAENFQTLILASRKDVRILLVKLADRLHNMRTLGICSDSKKRRKGIETMEIYVPLAERLGLHQIKLELENLAFQNMNPSGYKNITERLKEMADKQQANIKAVTVQLEKILKENKIKGYITSRIKSPYGLWRKLQTHGNNLKSIFDVLGFRVVVEKRADCYRVLGAVHEIYKAVPGRLKDYISTPKDSGYQSLHTTVITPKGTLLEIQIRTEQMEEEAQFGIAAHWSYKQGTKYDGAHLPWMKEFLELMKQSKNATDFLNKAKLHMYEDKLFCFDEKGVLYSLPKGATALDFACYQGSKVALKCLGVIVNEEEQPLTHVLQDGDKVKFLLSDKIVADKSWLKMVTTAQGQSLLEGYFAENIEEKPLSLWQKLFAKKTKNREVLGVPADMPYELDTLCHPTSKDSIVGILENNKVVIHSRNCPELKNYLSQKNKWLSVEWNTAAVIKHLKKPVNLVIVWKTGPESMGNVVNALSKTKVKIESVEVVLQETKKTKANVNIRVRNKDHLLDALDAIRAAEKVVSVYQVKEEK